MAIKTSVKVVIIISCVMILLGLFHGCQTSIKGTVLDAETGQPVEGALVLVEWTKQIGIGDYHTASMKVVETVTNREGKFNAFGPIHPFVDLPYVTIYKKGYVAWNNKLIFPDFKHREQTEGMYERVRLERYKAAYSHNKHIRFISLYSPSAPDEKKNFEAAYEWEVDLAREEVLRER